MTEDRAVISLAGFLRKRPKASLTLTERASLLPLVKGICEQRSDEITAGMDETVFAMYFSETPESDLEEDFSITKEQYEAFQDDFGATGVGRVSWQKLMQCGLVFSVEGVDKLDVYHLMSWLLDAPGPAR